MKTIITKTDVYSFDELYTEAQLKVKSWYINNIASMGMQHLVDSCIDELRKAFPNSHIMFQHSFETDPIGVNICGFINIRDIIALILSADEKLFGHTFYNLMSYDDLKEIEECIPICGEEIEIPVNNHGSKSMAGQIDFAKTWIGMKKAKQSPPNSMHMYSCWKRRSAKFSQHFQYAARKRLKIIFTDRHGSR